MAYSESELNQARKALFSLMKASAEAYDAYRALGRSPVDAESQTATALILGNVPGHLARELAREARATAGLREKDRKGEPPELARLEPGETFPGQLSIDPPMGGA